MSAFFFYFFVVPVVFASYGLSDAMSDLEAKNYPQHLLSGEAGTVEDFTNILQNFGNGIAGIAAVIAVLFLVYNAFNLVTAAGSTDKISKSRKGIIWSLVGLVVVIGAYVVVKTVVALPYVGPLT